VNREHVLFDVGDLDDDKWMTAIGYVEKIQDLAGELESALQEFSDLFPRVPRPVTNRDSLPWNFIDILSDIYESLTSAAPAVSKSGPFVRLVAAAWEDVDFPCEDRSGKKRDDIQGWLGDSIEKHPSVRRKR
jgi:hypothetical protein